MCSGPDKCACNLAIPTRKARHWASRRRQLDTYVTQLCPLNKSTEVQWQINANGTSGTNSCLFTVLDLISDLRSWASCGSQYFWEAVRATAWSSKLSQLLSARIMWHICAPIDVLMSPVIHMVQTCGRVGVRYSSPGDRFWSHCRYNSQGRYKDHCSKSTSLKSSMFLSRPPKFMTWAESVKPFDDSAKS